LGVLALGLVDGMNAFSDNKYWTRRRISGCFSDLEKKIGAGDFDQYAEGKF